jgi:hypothetical protein
MHRNLRIYGHEAERSHLKEGIVATAWTLLLIGMVAASWVSGGRQPESIETANIATSSAIAHVAPPR